MYAFRQKVKDFANRFKTVCEFLILDIKRRPGTFKIGLFTIYIVIVFLVLLQSILQLTPILFLSIAEGQSGMVDLELTPLVKNFTKQENFGMNMTLNITEIKGKIGNLTNIAALSSRWTFPINVSDPNNQTQNYRAIGIILDSQYERNNGIGANLNLKDLEDGECWISETLINLMQLSGNNVTIQVDIPTVLSDMSSNSSDQGSQSQGISQMLTEQLVNNNVDEEGLNMADLGMEDEITKKKQDAETMRNALHNSTRPDGTVDMPLFEKLLLAAGLSLGAFPPSMLQNNVRASTMESLLDNYERSLDEANYTVSRSELITMLTPIVRKTLNISQNYTVATVIDSPQGKWSSDYGNVIVIDSKYLAPMLAKRFFEVAKNEPAEINNIVLRNYFEQKINDPEYKEDTIHQSKEFDVNQFALQGNILLKQRTAIYRSQNNIKENMMKYSNNIFDRLGANYPVTITAPIAESLNTFFLFQSFLNNIFTEVTFLLIILSILLIYSLMNSNIEDKNYEFGILRVLGMRQSSVLLLLSFQSLFLAIPGLILGFISSYAINIIISFLIFDSALLITSYNLDGSAIAVGLCIGLLIPLVSNIFPIRKALSKTLLDFLKKYQRSIRNFTIKLTSFNRIGVSPSLTVSAFLLVIMGFLAYYIVPYAYMFSNMGLFFGVLNVVLMFMIIGLTFLANLLQGPLENFVLYILTSIFWKSKPLKLVIKKNFKAHKSKNKKTSLMFILALSFLIFAGTGFKLNANMIINQMQSTLGSDIVVTVLSSESTFLNEEDIRDQLEQFKIKFPMIIRDYAFVSQPFSYQPLAISPKLSPLTATPLLDVEIVSIDQSYLRASYEDFYVPESYDRSITLNEIPGSDKKDGVQALYERQDLLVPSQFDPNDILTSQTISQTSLNKFIGLQEARLIIPQGLASLLSLKGGMPSMITIGSTRTKTRVINVATKFPGFIFTGYKNSKVISTVLTSHEDFQYMRNIYWTIQAEDRAKAAKIEEYNNTIPLNSTYGVPKLGLLIRLEDNVDKRTRQKLFNYIQVLVDGKFTLTINVADMIEVLNDLLVYIDWIFIIISVIAIFISFFFTVVAFTSNIKENILEFGVLRATGLNKKQMNLTYTFEALSLIIAAGILGTSVGIVIALLTSIQFHFYTELPLEFIFPTTVFLVTFGASLFTAVFGPKIAVDQVKNKQIANIIKALD